GGVHGGRPALLGVRPRGEDPGRGARAFGRVDRLRKPARYLPACGALVAGRRPGRARGRRGVARGDAGRLLRPGPRRAAMARVAGSRRPLVLAVVRATGHPARGCRRHGLTPAARARTGWTGLTAPTIFNPQR